MTLDKAEALKTATALMVAAMDQKLILFPSPNTIGKPQAAVLGDMLEDLVYRIECIQVKPLIPPKS